MFIDVHAHLDLLKDVKDIIDSCKKKNIIIIAQGINPKTNRQVLELSEKNSNVKSAIGIYPDEILKLSDKEIENELSFIEKNIKLLIRLPSENPPIGKNKRKNKINIPNC